MYNLDELSAVMFGGTREDSVNGATSNGQTTIIYAVALEDSVDGTVKVQLDDAIYAIDDADDDYEYVTLTEDIDDVSSIDDDEEMQEEGQEEDVVYWVED